MPVHPEVLWAQRSSESDETKNIVYFTINLPDVDESSLKLSIEPTKISFAATSGNEKTGSTKDYAFELEFFKEIVPEKSGKKITTRSIALILRKKDMDAEYWPRLTKEKVKSAYIKTDFAKWVDEDEQDGEVKDKEDDDFDMSGMGGMGGMGGMPGMGGMGGMPGMPGMGGMGMPGMGGMGGMPGGMGDMDFEKMMAEMSKNGGPSGDAGGDDSDSDDDGPPPLEDA
ncbi:CS domain-containing protein [Mycena kentingensis (nom. inval.)]|nr:CS domain-containing protein [Mycena kentingensis (nom. inval.)]